MDNKLDLMLFRVIYTSLICYIFRTLGVEASRNIRGVKCRPGEYYSIPADGCISCHVPCDNAIMKKSQDDCSNFCPDFPKPKEHITEVITGSVQSDLSWVAGPIVGGFLTLILVLVLVIYCRRYSRFGIKKQRGSNGQRNGADPVHDEELQILDLHHGPGPHLGNPTVGLTDSGGIPVVSVHSPSEDPHNPLGLNNLPHDLVSDHPPRILYPFPKSKSLQDHAHHFHHPNQFCPIASQPILCSTSTDQPNDCIRGPIPYASELDYRVVEEESDTVVMKPVVGSEEGAQNGMNHQVVSGESHSLLNDNKYITQPHCSMDGNSTCRRVIEVQESLVRAEVSRSIPHSNCPNSRSQVYYNGNTSSVNKHNQCQPDLTGVTSNTFHTAVTEHSVHSTDEFLASPNIACFTIPNPTLISIPVIVEHPEGDPDNFEWQEQQHRAAQDKRCIHEPSLSINKHQEKEVSMDREKYIASNL
ncbi:hypothetical protein ACJMK2_033654 [Sinanodonta woodiana]|uniref:TNFR-Cys domain-containing protein n=1 Tax=Sinanodonta woodiana TaxID=1069815 RepID=A0ABD3WR65_SINWO